MPQGAVMPHAYPLCHCEPVPFILSLSKDVAISFPSTPPAHPQPSCHCEERAAQPVEPRGNLDEVEHTFANRRCYGDEIATLRSQ